MFPSDLAFSKAIMNDRLHRQPRVPVEGRVHRVENDRPTPRPARGR